MWKAFLGYFLEDLGHVLEDLGFFWKPQTGVLVRSLFLERLWFQRLCLDDLVFGHLRSPGVLDLAWEWELFCCCLCMACADDTGSPRRSVAPASWGRQYIPYWVSPPLREGIANLIAAKQPARDRFALLSAGLKSTLDKAASGTGYRPICAKPKALGQGEPPPTPFLACVNPGDKTRICAWLPGGGRSPSKRRPPQASTRMRG